MANITKGYTFGATEIVTNSKLHSLVDSATLTNVANGDISSSAAIAGSKINADFGSQLITGDAGITISGTSTFNDISLAGVLKLDGSAGTSGQVLTSQGSSTTPTWGYGVPTGCILLWSGAISAIPAGFHICDGTNGTPNLTDRFVIHADADSGGTNDVGDTGGSRTISEANLPAHTHTINHGHDLIRYLGDSGASDTVVVGSNNQTATNSNVISDYSGSSGSIGSGTDYMPKYYALAYIMKL